MSPYLHLGKTTTTEKQNKQITCKIFNILIAFDLAFYNINQQKNDFKGKKLITITTWIEKQTKIFQICIALLCVHSFAMVLLTYVRIYLCS